MGGYTSFKDGYAKETTPGTSIIDGVGDTAYLWGAHFDPAVHPSPVAKVQYASVGVKYIEYTVTAGTVGKVTFMYQEQVIA